MKTINAIVEIQKREHLTAKKTYCPVNGWDCPYYKEGVCHIDNPLDDCDDWDAFFETWQDWIEA